MGRFARGLNPIFYGHLVWTHYNMIWVLPFWWHALSEYTVWVLVAANNAWMLVQESQISWSHSRHLCVTWPLEQMSQARGVAEASWLSTCNNVSLTHEYIQEHSRTFMKNHDYVSNSEYWLSDWCYTCIALLLHAMLTCSTRLADSLAWSRKVSHP
jgi:hypothetical protein